MMGNLTFHRRIVNGHHTFNSWTGMLLLAMNKKNVFGRYWTLAHYALMTPHVSKCM